ncbi:hypothetical protein, partial [Pseudomonas syringae group genomosp. 7]|uniref:hypothetical protein n=1 Tax=Pseudomonas syringae group genomosp. 7 TaxID=251699 RepID=UPI0037706FA1
CRNHQHYDIETTYNYLNYSRSVYTYITDLSTTIEEASQPAAPRKGPMTSKSFNDAGADELEC